MLCYCFLQPVRRHLTKSSEIAACKIHMHGVVRKIFTRVYKFEHMGPTRDRGGQKILSRGGEEYGEALISRPALAGWG